MGQVRNQVTGEILSEINDLILASIADGTNSQGGTDEISTEVENGGSLLMDASRTSAAVRYPSELSLLSDAREMT